VGFWATKGIRVKPGSSATTVGGSYGGSLVVRVTARAVDGAATESALVALAAALGVRRQQVRLVTGATARDKVVAVDLVENDLQQRWSELLNGIDP